MSTSGMTFVPDFLKIGPLVQKFTGHITW